MARRTVLDNHLLFFIRKSRNIFRTFGNCAKGILPGLARAQQGPGPRLERPGPGRGRPGSASATACITAVLFSSQSASEMCIRIRLDPDLVGS